MTKRIQKLVFPEKCRVANCYRYTKNRTRLCIKHELQRKKGRWAAEKEALFRSYIPMIGKIKVD